MAISHLANPQPTQMSTYFMDAPQYEKIAHERTSLSID